MLPTLDETLVQFVAVRKVEVARDHEIFGGPVAFSEVRMARGGSIAAGGPVTQMTKEDFSAMIEVRLHGLRKLRVDLTGIQQFLIMLQLLAENLGEGVRTRAALAKHESLACGNVQLHGTDAGAVLSPVVLLLHEKEKLIEAP